MQLYIYIYTYLFVLLMTFRFYYQAYPFKGPVSYDLFLPLFIYSADLLYVLYYMCLFIYCILFVYYIYWCVWSVVFCCFFLGGEGLARSAACASELEAEFAWYDTIQYDTIRYNTIRTMRYDTIQWLQYDTIRCDAMQCNTMQCNTIQYIHQRTYVPWPCSWRYVRVCVYVCMT